MSDLRALNLSAPETAREELLRCCGSTRWAEAMIRRRPFFNEHAVYAAAEDVWRGLEPRDWLEAFSRHPRIGDREALRQKFARTWAAGEQAGAAGAPEAVFKRLAELNRAYEERFGHIFIISASGKSAQEMVAALEARLGNARAAELRAAAAEQAKITRIRLEKLLRS